MRPQAESALGFDHLLQRLASLNVADPDAERIAPLLYRATGSAAHRKAHYECAATNVVMLDARDEVGEALNARGIRAVLFKGGDLADRLYPSPALRPMSDVDLWVDGDEAGVAEAVLESRGFRPFMPEMAPGITRLTKHARLFVRDDGAAIDLHWSLVGHESDRRTPSLEWFRRRVVPREKSAPFARFDDTAHLLYLAAHMKLQHRDETPTLLWLVDFLLLADSESLRWDDLFDAAARFGWTRALSDTLGEIQSRLGLGLTQVQEAEASAPSRGHTAPKGSPERALQEMAALGVKGRLCLLRGYFLPTPSYLAWRYRPRHRWSLPLYYLVRWGQIARALATVSTKRGLAR